jgi:hypothetical protein
VFAVLLVRSAAQSTQLPLRLPDITAFPPLTACARSAVEAPGERSNGFPLSALFIPSCVSAVMLNVCCAGWVFLLWWVFSWLPASTGFDWMIRYSSASC